MESKEKKVVIIANGSFPVHEVPLGFLREADLIVCCDGAAGKLVDAGYLPDAIVGDMDSLGEGLKIRFADRLYPDVEQESNDLTKAVRWCCISGYPEVVILGATGMREDHTIGNISLLAEYIREIRVRMVTDFGMFIPLRESCCLKSLPGQQISLFSI